MSAGRVGTMRVRNGRYFDGVTSYQRTSNALKEIETDTYHLDEWRANMLAVGLSMRSDLVLGVASAAQFDAETGKLTREAKSTLRGLRYQAEQAAKSKAGANQGTAIHTATERLDFGESVEAINLPAPFDRDLRAYAALKDAMGLTYQPDHIERTVRIEGFGVAGTYDRLGRSRYLEERGILAPGELIVVDVKTESAPLMNMIHIAPQLAFYAHGEDVFVPEPRPTSVDDPNGEYAGRWERMPQVNVVAALVIHVRDGRATPYLVDLTAGWDGVQAAVRQRDRIKAAKTELGKDGSWAILLPIDLPEQAPAVQGIVEAAAARGPLGYSAPAGMTPQQYAATAHLPRAEAAAAIAGPPPGGYQVGDTVTVGGIEFTKHAELPTGAELVGGHGPMPTTIIDEHPLETMLVEAIHAAPTREVLAALYDKAVEHGVPWVGQVEQAANLRFAIVECPQRSLHTPQHGGACACGWIHSDPA